MENELYHHGILGQKWGERNGPPYPLSFSVKSIAEKRKMRKAQKKKEQNLEKARKARAEKLETERRNEETRNRLSKTGSAAEIYENRGLFTPQELNVLYNKLQTESNIKSLADKSIPREKTKAEKYSDVANTVAKATALATTLKDGYNFVAETVNSISKGDKKLPILGQKKNLGNEVFKALLKDGDISKVIKSAENMSVQDLRDMSSKITYLDNIKQKSGFLGGSKGTNIPVSIDNGAKKDSTSASKQTQKQTGSASIATGVKGERWVTKSVAEKKLSITELDSKTKSSGKAFVSDFLTEAMEAGYNAGIKAAIAERDAETYRELHNPDQWIADMFDDYKYSKR